MEGEGLGVASLASERPQTEANASAQPSSVPACAVCGEWDFSPNVEAYEIADVLVCDECALGEGT